MNFMRMWFYFIRLWLYNIIIGTDIFFKARVHWQYYSICKLNVIFMYLFLILWFMTIYITSYTRIFIHMYSFKRYTTIRSNRLHFGWILPNGFIYSNITCWLVYSSKVIYFLNLTTFDSTKINWNWPYS